MSGFIGAYGALAESKAAAATAELNARLRARELIGQAQIAENQVLQQEREAQISEQAATQEREATAVEVGRHREQGRAFQAEQAVEVAGSGLEATGSPLLVMGETAKQLELDRQAMTYQGELAARQREEEARMARYGGSLAQYQAKQLREGVPLTLDIGRYQARSARYAGRIGAVGRFISGTTQDAFTAASAYKAFGK